MRRHFAERGVLLVAATATALSVIAGVFGYIEVGPPVKAAASVLAVGVGYWVYKDWDSPGGRWLPDPWRAALVLTLSLLVGFALAWNEGRPSGRTHFDFVVNPRARIVTAESIAPDPRTQSRSAPLHGYGEHLTVICYTWGSDHHIWYRLADRNFISERDLVPAPLSGGSPPRC